MRWLLPVLCVWLMAWPAAAQDGLHDRPVLVLDPGFHTAPIRRADVDEAGRFAVTASEDRNVRLFDAADGRLLRTLRLPTGPGNVGKAYAVAISPDASLVAAGGWTNAAARGGHPIYLFDRKSGALVQRLDGLPDVVNHLAFSPDGRFLAASLWGANGVRVYDRDADWAEVFADQDYGDSSYGAAFTKDGRLATTSDDGRIRLYGPGPAFAKRAEITAPDGARPFGLAFRPQGDRLAVGYEDTTAVSLLDTTTLTPRQVPDTADLTGGNLSKIAWSADGETLFAGGSYPLSGRSEVIAWAEAGTGARRALPASANTIMSLAPLPAGDLLVAATDPYLARLATDGTSLWTLGPPQANFRAVSAGALNVSADGTVVDFGYEPSGANPARFDLAALDLTLDPTADDRTAKPRHDGLPVENWFDHTRPTLDGEPLPLQPHEISRSLAIHPAGDRFVLGADWSLRAFDDTGTELWQRPAPGVTWAVNVTGDGRLVVAAYGDGTLRWHAMGDGRELLALFPLQDRKNWVAWTPEGYYAATPGAHGVLRWHVNRGWDEAPEAIPVENVAGLRRPDVLPLVLQELDVVRALGLAQFAADRRAIVRATGASIAPGARLHVLAMGVSDYGDAARHLRLSYAHKDALDVASALASTQGGDFGLYAKVNRHVLRDGEVSKVAMLRALDSMRGRMAKGEGRDVAVVHFSGHGALVDGSLYLLPHEVDASSPSMIEATALPVGMLRDKIAKLAEHGRVLVLLDACRTGGVTGDDVDFGLDARSLRSQLARANVTVLTSSTAEEDSIEREVWQNGAFTEAFLDALNAADHDRNGLISVSDLAGYVALHVPELTEGAHRPDVDQNFTGELFVSGS
ncbi:MAG: caspase family protein [Pseudomonadota bacterium]